jgi:hypothetical protein
LLSISSRYCGCSFWIQAAFKPYFANRGAIGHGQDLVFTVNIKNTGAVESDVVVLCFVSSTTNPDGPRYGSITDLLTRMSLLPLPLFIVD